ncbi:hypothetical protein Tco_1381901, partial [Tanacetum coccineum]
MDPVGNHDMEKLWIGNQMEFKGIYELGFRISNSMKDLVAKGSRGSNEMREDGGDRW